VGQASLKLLFRTDFLITTSVDGHVKLWKKQETGIEFIKHYRAHMQPVVGVSASTDGQLFATISTDGTAKVFDVVNFGKCLLLVFTCEAHERLQI
jgi:peptidylprolyl isomerase domain and WD repeat-containing protein 1